MTRFRYLFLAVVVVAACGGSEPAATTGPSSRMTVPTGVPVPMCEGLEWFTGPEALYADSPVYVGNEMPIEIVTAYAEGMDGFVQAWIDRQHNGWVNVGFAGIDIGAAQEELSAAFPDDGVVAVELPYTDAELESIRRQVAEALPADFDASNYHLLHGRVEVWVGSLTDENVAVVQERVGDKPVCVAGNDPATTPQPGPQPEGGEGWLYLGEFDVSLGNMETVVAVAGGDRTLAELWSGLGGGEVPEVDFERSIVVAVEMGYSGSCPETRLDEVTFEGKHVRLVINTITEEMACTDDYNPRVYVISIDRSALPQPPFTVGRHDAPALAVEIHEDLREPGAEPGRVGPAPEPAPEVDIPDVIEVGFPWEATIDLDCGIERLGEINGVQWRTDAELPQTWRDLAGEDGLLTVSLLMSEGPDPTLTVTAGNDHVVYLPTDEVAESCP